MGNSPSPSPRTHYTVHCTRHPSNTLYSGYDYSRKCYWSNTNCWEICSYCIAEKERNAQKKAEDQHKAQLQRITDSQQWIQNIGKDMDEQQNRLNELQDKLESNVKKGVFDDTITVSIADEDNPLVQIASIQAEISQNFQQLAENANKCYMAGEYMEQSVDKFEELLENDKNQKIPAFMPTIIRQQKLRATNMKILKKTLAVEFKNHDFANNINTFNEAINSTKNLLDDIPQSMKTQYRLILHQEGVESIGDLVGLEKSDLVSMGIRPIHAIKILKKLNKCGEVKANFKLLSDKLTKLQNAVKTVKKAFAETEKDLNKFVSACDDIKLQFDTQIDVADAVDQISNNLDELIRRKVTGTTTKEVNFKGNYWKEGAVIGSGVGFAGAAIGLAVAAKYGATIGVMGGLVGVAIGAVVGAVIGGIIGFFCKKKRRKTAQKYYETEVSFEDEKVDRENTKEALQKLATVIKKMAEQNKDRFGFDDNDKKEIDDQQTELQKNKKTLSTIEVNIKQINDKLKRLQPSIDKLGGNDVDDLKNKLQNLMKQIDRDIQNVANDMADLNN